MAMLVSMGANLYHNGVNSPSAELPDRPKETLIIVNPAAYNLPNSQSLSAAGNRLNQLGWKVNWEETRHPGDAIGIASRAAEKRLPVVFACGGDGTINEIANGLAGSETAMAMIRGGVSNIWAREIGIPRHPTAAAQACIEGARRRIDLGKVGDRYFVLMAGYGLDGLVTEKVSLRLKKRIGAAAFALTAIKESIGYQGKLTTLIMDGERVTGYLLMLVAGNSRNYGGLAQITPEANIDDGLIDVCAFMGRDFGAVIRHFLRVAIRRHRKSKGVIYRRVRNLELMWEHPIPLHVDGDYYHPSPNKIEVAQNVLDVMVPLKSKTRLFSR